jgi:hypothetical protein
MPGHLPWRLGAAIAVVLTASCAVDPAVEYRLATRARLAGGRIPRLADSREMIYLESDPERIRAGYAFAATAVALLVERLGADAPVRCARLAAAHYTVGGALKRLYGLRLADFQTDWHVTLASRYAS